MDKKYHLVEFSDGKMIIPLCWMSANKQDVLLPKNYSSATDATLIRRIRKQEKPRDDWSSDTIVKVHLSSDDLDYLVYRLSQLDHKDSLSDTDMEKKRKRRPVDSFMKLQVPEPKRQKLHAKVTEPPKVLLGNFPLPPALPVVLANSTNHGSNSVPHTFQQSASPRSVAITKAKTSCTISASGSLQSSSPMNLATMKAKNSCSSSASASLQSSNPKNVATMKAKNSCSSAAVLTASLQSASPRSVAITKAKNSCTSSASGSLQSLGPTNRATMKAKNSYSSAAVLTASLQSTSSRSVATTNAKNFRDISASSLPAALQSASSVACHCPHFEKWTQLVLQEIISIKEAVSSMSSTAQSSDISIFAKELPCRSVEQFIEFSQKIGDENLFKAAFLQYLLKKVEHQLKLSDAVKSMLTWTADPRVLSSFNMEGRLQKMRLPFPIVECFSKIILDIKHLRRQMGSLSVTSIIGDMLKRMPRKASSMYKHLAGLEFVEVSDTDNNEVDEKGEEGKDDDDDQGTEEDDDDDQGTGRDDDDDQGTGRDDDDDQGTGRDDDGADKLD